MKTISIGRGSDCDIVLTYDKISRHHAQISVVNGQYLYHDVSKNGSNIGGQIIVNQKVVVAPGTTILLANKIPLPWEQVYRMLSPSGRDINGSETRAGDVPYILFQQSCSSQSMSSSQVEPPPRPEPYPAYVVADCRRDTLGVGWGILAFVFPLAGWIMYFVWKDETPNRAKWAGVIASLAFFLNMFWLFA